ncbi:pilus assembly protein PilP [Petrachloros mirabilis]
MEGRWVRSAAVVVISMTGTLCGVELVLGADLVPHAGQVAPLRQESVKVPNPADLTRDVPVAQSPGSPTEGDAGMTGVLPPDAPPMIGGYDPSGRRDPFLPVLSQLAPGQADPTLPPLQRVSLTDMNLIAVVWGAYGYTAMMQTPDGNGYTIRKGTRIGPNNGVVSAVTEKGIIVQERYTDVYGRKQEREYVKLLHPKEGLE